MRLTLNVPLSCQPSIEYHLEKVFAGEYDVPVFLARPTILDLGANCGAFSVWAAHRWPGAEIHAYEPHNENFGYLVANASRYSNITTNNYAVGTPGMRPLFEGRFNSGEVSLHKIMNNPAPLSQGHIEVHPPLEMPEADIIKIDTEGCELEILRPLIAAERSFKAILFEYHCESDRRELDILLKDYHLVGSTVESPLGRGVCRYIHNDLAKEM